MSGAVWASRVGCSGAHARSATAALRAPLVPVAQPLDAVDAGGDQEHERAPVGVPAGGADGGGGEGGGEVAADAVAREW